MNWATVTGRVVVEACNATRDDVVLLCGDRGVEAELAVRVRRIVVADDLTNPPEGLSILCLHQWLRHRTPADQHAAFVRAAALLPERGLLVVGDVMWSLPREQIDAPEQFGDSIEHVQTTDTLERWARASGFLPDLHRFGPGAGVLVSLRGPR